MRRLFDTEFALHSLETSASHVPARKPCEVGITTFENPRSSKTVRLIRTNVAIVILGLAKSSNNNI